MSILTAGDISEARERLARTPRILNTPTLYSASLSEKLGSEYGFPVHVYLKLESLQTSRSYKIRGAFNKVSKLVMLYGAERIGQIVAASAGNHAQGVGFSARYYGLQEKTVIHMPAGAPWVKRKGTAAYGVKVNAVHPDFESARKAANDADDEDAGSFLIHPYDDPDVMAGQGTIAAEILEALETDPRYVRQEPGPVTILCPIGGGGLLSGVATWVKETAPHVRVVGVEPLGAAKTRQSLERDPKSQKQERFVRPSPPKTMADGVSVVSLGEKTFEVIRSLLGPDDICTVSELRILRAIRMLTAEGIVAEGAGALALASLIDYHERTPGTLAEAEYEPGESRPLQLEPNACVVLIVSGSNLSSGVLAEQIRCRLGEEEAEEAAQKQAPGESDGESGGESDGESDGETGGER